MLERVTDLLNRHGLAPGAARLLVAVSGGVDSVVLLHALKTLGFETEVAHMNYGLRGEASEADQRFVQDLAESLGLVFHTKRQQISPEENTQLAARDARYGWLEEIRQQRALDWIATGHHAHDHLETLLFRLMRGTGIAGMAGIPEVRGSIIRPMRNVLRPHVEAYAKSHGLKWREDSSNATDHYARNRIRHHLVPVLEEMEPDMAEHWLQQSAVFAAAQRQIEAAADGLESDELLLPFSMLQPHHPVLWELLKRRAFTPGQLDEVVAMQTSDSGMYVASSTHQAWMYKGQLRVVRLETESLSPQTFQTWEELGKVLNVEHVAPETIPPSTLKNPANFICDTAEISFPIVLRSWQQGDRIQPLGMKGSQLLSDMFQQARIPPYERNRYALLKSPEGILWVEKLRRSRHGLLQPSTKNAVIVSLRPIV